MTHEYIGEVGCIVLIHVSIQYLRIRSFDFPNACAEVLCCLVDVHETVFEHEGDGPLAKGTVVVGSKDPKNETHGRRLEKAKDGGMSRCLEASAQSAYPVCRPRLTNPASDEEMAVFLNETPLMHWSGHPVHSFRASSISSREGTAASAFSSRASSSALVGKDSSGVA